jgi:D-3-phosphoglycerate dehydrogenase / 2-oxoglutarate reductase
MVPPVLTIVLMSPTYQVTPRRLRSTFERALVIENPDPLLDDLLREQGIEVDRLPESSTLNRAEVIEALREGRHDLIFKRSRFEIDDEVLTASPNLAAVMLCCIGFDSVDLEACARHGVLVMNDPVSNGRSVAELVVGETILLARRVLSAHEAGRHHRWVKDSVRRFEVKGKVLGIIGLGNIGKQVAQLAEAMGMEIIFYDQSELAQEVGRALGWAACRTIDDVFRGSDFLTLHVSSEDPRGRSNQGIITYSHLTQLGSDRGPKSPRGFINLARGFIVDPNDLKRAVEEGHVRAAAVDVFPEEPGSKDDPWVNPYADFEEIVTTPHIGAATEEAQPRIASYVAGTARLLNKLGTVRDTVYAPRQMIGVSAPPPYWALTVVHSDARGTKKAIDDIIYNAGASNIESTHRDFAKFGIAYDVSAIDRKLDDADIDNLIAEASRITGDPAAVLAIRQFYVPDDRSGK